MTNQNGSATAETTEKPRTASEDGQPEKPRFDVFRERLEQTRSQIPEQTPEEIAERDAQEQRNLRAEWQANWRALGTAARLGNRADHSFENFTITDPAQQNAVDALQEYLEKITDEVRRGSGIVWVGPCGTGKDHLLISTLRPAVEQHGLDAVWKYGLSLYGDMRDAISSDSRESELINKYTKPTILALSDPVPPAGDLSAYQATMLQRIIDERYRLKRPTWVTANAKGFDDLAQRIGWPIADRLCDDALVIKCNWPGHRKPRRVIN